MAIELSKIRLFLDGMPLDESAVYEVPLVSPADADRISPETVLRCTPVCGYCGTAAQPARRIDRRIPYGRTTVIRLYCSERCRDEDADDGAPLLSCIVCGLSIPTLLFAAHGPLCVRCRGAGHALEGAW